MINNTSSNITVFLIIIFSLFSFNALSFEKFNLNEIDPVENIIVEDFLEFLQLIVFLRCHFSPSGLTLDRYEVRKISQLEVSESIISKK